MDYRNGVAGRTRSRKQGVSSNIGIPHIKSRNNYFDEDDVFEYLEVRETTDEDEDLGEDSGKDNSSEESELEMIDKDEYMRSKLRRTEEVPKEKITESGLRNGTKRHQHLANDQTTNPRKRSSNFGSKKTRRVQRVMEIEKVSEAEFLIAREKAISRSKHHSPEKGNIFHDEMNGTKESDSANPTGLDKNRNEAAESDSIGWSSSESECDKNHNTENGLGRETQSKSGIASKPTVDKTFVIIDSSDGSKSSPCESEESDIAASDSEYDDLNDEELTMDQSSDGKEELWISSDEETETEEEEELSEEEEVEISGGNIRPASKRQTSLESSRDITRGLEKSVRRKENGFPGASRDSVVTSRPKKFKRAEDSEEECEGDCKTEEELSEEEKVEILDRHAVKRQTILQFSRDSSHGSIQEGLEKSGKRKESGLPRSSRDSVETSRLKKFKKAEYIDGKSVLDSSKMSGEKKFKRAKDVEEESEGDSKTEEELSEEEEVEIPDRHALKRQTSLKSSRDSSRDNVQEGLKESGRSKGKGLLKSYRDSIEMSKLKKLKRAEDINGKSVLDSKEVSKQKKSKTYEEDDNGRTESNEVLKTKKSKEGNDIKGKSVLASNEMSKQKKWKKVEDDNRRSEPNEVLNHKKSKKAEDVKRKSSLDSDESLKQKTFKEGKDIDGKSVLASTVMSKQKKLKKVEDDNRRSEPNEVLNHKKSKKAEDVKRRSSLDSDESLKQKRSKEGEDVNRRSSPDSNEVPKRKKIKRGEDVDAVNNMNNVASSSKQEEHIPPTKEVVDEPEGNDKPTITTSRIYPRSSYGFCKRIMDNVLENGAEMEDDEEENKQPEVMLPTKFRFEDEDPEPVEKSDEEIMMEALWAEMDMCLTYGDVDVPCYEKTEEEIANDEAADEEMSQYARCCKGKHYLVEDEVEGRYCLYCLHNELEAKYLMPAWEERTYGRGEKGRRREAEHSSEKDGLNFDFELGNNDDSSSHTTGTVWDIKPGTKRTMYEHQQEGLEFLWKNVAGTINLTDIKMARDSNNIGGCIISHAPGTGKTRLTMVFLETYLKVFPKSRPLIIAPAGMLLTWEEEFKKWGIEFPFHNLSSLEFSGKESKSILKSLPAAKILDKDAIRMVKISSWINGRSVLGMSYSLFESLAGEEGKKVKTPFLVEHIKTLRDILLEKPGIVVLDEGHIPRNQSSNIWVALLKLKTDKRVILSGTPFQNNFMELFNILRIVRPETATSLAKEKIFADMIAAKNATANNTAAAIEELKVAMSPFVHVHKGTILRENLPGLRDCLVLLNPPPLQKSLIEKIEWSQNSFKFDHKVALLSVHPYLVKHCNPTKTEKSGVDQKAVEASKNNPLEGVKTRFIIELIRLSIAKNEKVLIFSQYIQPLKLTMTLLKKTFKWSAEKQILMIQGRMDQRRRQGVINDFNSPDSEAKVLLASTKCCSEGISLVGASRVVLLDVVWNPSVERQAISRAYRLGQKRIVYTYHLMTAGTKEGDKFQRQAEKDRLSDLVFTSSSNEKCAATNLDMDIKDGILDHMRAHQKLGEMFDKICYQPKEQDLIETFA